MIMRLSLEQRWVRLVKRMYKYHWTPNCPGAIGGHAKTGHVEQMLWYIDRIDRLGAIINIKV